MMLKFLKQPKTLTNKETLPCAPFQTKLILP